MIGNDVWQAATFLRQGKLVAIPTETVYGLAANALDGDAVASIFEAKGRPTFNPLIVHVASLDQLGQFVKEIDDRLWQLAQNFMPGPLTLLLPKKDLIPDLVTAGSERVAIRVPDHALTLELLQQLDFPLAAPSANPFGYISPTTAWHVAQQLGEKTAYILDGGPCKVGLESTIVGVEGDEVIVYRKGGLAIEDIEQVVGSVVVREHSSSTPEAPGMLSAHYAPGKPLVLGKMEDLVKQYAGKKTAIISFREVAGEIRADYVKVLSPAGDLKEAAQKLFGVLRECDGLPVEVILGEWLPEQGLGRAINDRLRRASVGSANV